MPRKDRTFTPADVFRIYCNNLDPEEQLLVLRVFNFGDPCTFPRDLPFIDTICPRLRDLQDTVEVVCTYAFAARMAIRRFKTLSRILPLRILFSAIDEMCGQISFILEQYRLVCPDEWDEIDTRLPRTNKES